MSAIEKNRRKLIPLWIKVFGWLFILMGVSAPILLISMGILGKPVQLMIYGLEYQGAPFDLKALLMAGLLTANGLAAYGLLFGRDWGLNVCLLAGYIYMIICLNNLIQSGYKNINVELFVLVSYLMKLHTLRGTWYTAASLENTKARK